jgi:hypothetical protein
MRRSEIIGLKAIAVAVLMSLGFLILAYQLDGGALCL